MMSLKLTVYAELKEQEYVKALRSAYEPDNVILEFSDRTDGSVTEFADDHAHMVITDDYARIEKLRKLTRHNLRFIYVGKAKLTDDIEDVWDTGDTDEIRARFERVLRASAYQFDAWVFEHTLYTTIDTVPDMLWFKRLDGIHTMVNSAFTEVVHKKREDIIGRDHFFIWDAPRPAEGNEFACAESEETAIRTGKTFICDEPVQTREGMKQLTTYKTPVYDMFGNVFGTVGVGHDVTNFSNLGIELDILVENMPFPMIIFTAEMKVVKMNNSFMEIAGVEKDKMSGFLFADWRQKNCKIVTEKIGSDNDRLIMQEIQIHLGAEDRSYLLRLQEIRDFFDNISGYFLIMTDITYQRAYEQSILKAANTDMLTGMYNRRYFYNYLSEHALEPMTLFYMDLDRFKYVNDKYGHQKGDEVLIKTANAIKTLFPKAENARLGGDEFALVLPGMLGDEEIKEYTAVLERTIQRIFSADGLPVTMSVGTAVHDGKNADMDRFMHISDSRMYEVKKEHHKDEEGE